LNYILKSQSKKQQTQTTKSNTGAHVAPRDQTMWQRERRHLIVGIIFIVGTLLLLLRHHPMSFKASTMGIATRSFSRQQPTQKSIIAKTTPPKGEKHRSERTNKSPTSVDKSPTSVDVNSLLAEINLPQTRFDNALRALGHACQARLVRPLACLGYCGQRYGTILLF
jgi:hypothetical protein